jgi:aminoglycoside phosphotransferase (APT) family kinase protein
MKDVRNAQERSEVVRQLPGPFGMRLCVGTADGFTWLLRCPRPIPIEARRALELAQASLATDIVLAQACCLPRLIDEKTLLHPPASTPNLLCDFLFHPNAIAAATHAWASLGIFLAHLHSIPAEDVPLASETPWPRWAQPLDAGRAAAIQSIRGRLERSSSLAHWGAPQKEHAKTLVHGRMSTSAVCYGAATDAIRVVDWLDVGRGDGEKDLGTLIAQLAESLACQALGSNDARRFMDDLIRPRPAGADLGLLRTYARSALIDHITLRIHTSGHDAPAINLFHAAETELASLLAEHAFAQARPDPCELSRTPGATHDPMH